MNEVVGIDAEWYLNSKYFDFSRHLVSIDLAKTDMTPIFSSKNITKFSRDIIYISRSWVNQKYSKHQS